MLWTDSPIHFVDFEGNRECGIIEYGVATLLNREIVATQTRLCMAHAEIRSIESQLHGIQYSATQNKNPFSDEWEYFNQLRKSGPLAAHHASTENSLLKVVWPYPNYSPDFLNTDQEIAEWGPWLDTCAIALNLYPQLLSHKLQDLIDYFDLGHRLDVLTSQHCPSNRRHYHCALYDAIASAVLLIHVGSLSGFEKVTLSWLLNRSCSSPSQSEQTELF